VTSGPTFVDTAHTRAKWAPALGQVTALVWQLGWPPGVRRRPGRTWHVSIVVEPTLLKYTA